MKEYGNSISFIGDLEPEDRMVRLAARQLAVDYLDQRRRLPALPLDFPGVQMGPIEHAREPCPADLESHEDCPLCEGTCQGPIIPGKYVHSYGWYVVVD
jgi:hypothetical protein